MEARKTDEKPLSDADIDKMVDQLMRPAIYAVKRRVQQIIQECARQKEPANEDALAALKAILTEPYGCQFCDSGVLRNRGKPHDVACGYAMAKAVIGVQPPRSRDNAGEAGRRY